MASRTVGNPQRTQGLACADRRSRQTAPTNGKTGLVIPVPAGDALLEWVEARHAGSVRQGVPARVSLLYPFVGVAELDDRDIEGLISHLRMPISYRAQRVPSV